MDTLSEGGFDKLTVLERAAKARENWTWLQTWIREQRALPAKDGPLDPNIKLVLDEVLEASGIKPSEYVAPPARGAKQSDADAPAETKTAAPAAPAQPQPQAAPAVTSLKTRAQVYEVYYAAIVKYNAAKKCKPEKLTDLVAGGYIAPDVAGLDGAGHLICPETHDVLMYSRSAKLGNPYDMLLFDAKNTADTPALFGSGKIQVLSKMK